MFLPRNLKEEIYCNKLKILSSIVKNGFYSDFCHIFVLDFVICSSLHPCVVSLLSLWKFIYDYNGKKKERAAAA